MSVAAATVRLNGDGKDAERALEGVAKEAKQTEKALEGADKAGMDMGKAMAGVAVVAAGLAAATAAVTSAVQAYTAANEGAAQTISGLSAQMTGMQEAIGGAIFRSEGFQEAMGRASQVMGFLEDNAESIANVVSGALTFAINGAIVAIDAWNTAVAGVKTTIVVGEAVLDGLATWVVNLQSDITVLTNSVIDFGLAFAQGFIGIMGQAVGAIGSFVSAAAPIASLVGLDLGPAVQGLTSYQAELDGAVEGLQDMRVAIAASTAEQQRSIDANNEALAGRQADRVEELVVIEQELTDALQATAGSQAHAVEGLREMGAAATATAGAVAALVAEVNKLALDAARAEEARKAAIQTALDTTAGKDAAGLGAVDAERLAGEEAKYAATEALALKHAEAMEAIKAGQVEREAAIAAQREALAQQERDVMASVGAEIVSQMLTTGKLSAKAAAASVKGVLDAKALEQGLLGLANLIPPPFNPTGNPGVGAQQLLLAAKFKAGSLALGAFGGLAGGGGGQGLSAAGAGSAPVAGAAPVAPQNSTVINNSFGLVGDPRGAARLIRDTLAYGQADGL
jgi:hypothetical protein